MTTSATVDEWLKPSVIVPVEPETIVTLLAEVVRLRAACMEWQSIRDGLQRIIELRNTKVEQLSRDLINARTNHALTISAGMTKTALK